MRHMAVEIPQEVLHEAVQDYQKMANLIDASKLEAVDLIRDNPFDLNQLEMIKTYIRALCALYGYDKK